MRREFRIFAALAVLIGFGWSQAHAQVPMTGAGRGAPAASGGGSVTPDVFGPTSGASIYQASSNNFNKTPITITAGLTNPGLVCMLIRADAANDVTTGVALTWDGVSMALRETQSSGVGGNVRVAFLFGLRNPASGNKTLNVSATNTAADNIVNCISFSNVNQTSDAAAFPNPVGNLGQATLDVTSASGHIAVGAFINAGGTIIPTIVINDSVSGSLFNYGADYVVSSGATTTVGTSSSQQAIAGMDVSN